LSRTFLLSTLLALGLAAGCKAQQTPLDAAATRRIEVIVRSQFGVPQDVALALGARSASAFSGYDTLPITLSKNGHNQTINFLLSRDGKTLGRMDSFDLSKDPMAAIDTAGRPVRGAANAQVTLVSYDDLECPYCARMHQTLFPGILDRYKDKIRIVYKDDPLTEIHPWAMHAAVDANCLNAQKVDAYWDYVDYIHAHMEEVSGEDRDPVNAKGALDRIARQHGDLFKLDAAKLNACLAKQDETQVKASMKEAYLLGIEGTPVLFIDGERIAGLVPEASIKLAIDRALRAHGVEPPKDEAAAPKPAAK
jgi:protein-disulfide isomerase